MSKKFLHTLWRLFLVIAAGALMSFNIKTFVHAGALIPGGFNGLSILLQQICLRFGNFNLPFSVPLYILNAVPAVVCFKFIGKKFTIYSVLAIVVTGVLADSMPS